ncbi:MAG: peptidylprolyl isomerase, partial [Actinomycetota bacterium]
ALDRERGEGGEPRGRAASDIPRCTEGPPPSPVPRNHPTPPDPSSVVEPGVDLVAIVATSCGELTIDLLEGAAPETVSSFVSLARTGFFDGLEWFRVERDAVIQTGDPNGVVGEPPDGPGYTFRGELPRRGRDYRYGIVAMAPEGPPVGASERGPEHVFGSQWFIVVHEEGTAGLDPFYPIFGRVDPDSYETLELIAKQPVAGGTDPTAASRPQEPIYILSIEIVER